MAPVSANHGCFGRPGSCVSVALPGWPAVLAASMHSQGLPSSPVAFGCIKGDSGLLRLGVRMKLGRSLIPNCMGQAPSENSDLQCLSGTRMTLNPSFFRG